MKKRERKEIPEINELKAELNRVNYKRKYIKVFKSTVYTLVVVAAFAVLVATLWMPVLQIYGSSMTPTIDEGQIVVSVKGKDFEQGDLVAFYIGNKLLVKRVIACPSDYVLVDENGTVYRNTEGYDLTTANPMKIYIQGSGVLPEELHVYLMLLNEETERYEYYPHPDAELENPHLILTADP